MSIQSWLTNIDSEWTFSHFWGSALQMLPALQIQALHYKYKLCVQCKILKSKSEESRMYFHLVWHWSEWFQTYIYFIRPERSKSSVRSLSVSLLVWMVLELPLLFQKVPEGVHVNLPVCSFVRERACDLAGLRVVSLLYLPRFLQLSWRIPWQDSRSLIAIMVYVL